MKIVVRSSSLLLAFVAILSNARAGRGRAALQRGVVGRLRIGMSLKELLHYAQPARMDHSDGNTVTLLVDKESTNAPALSAYISDGSISQFQVFSDKFRTDIGIGVGSSLEELRSCYDISRAGTDFAYVESLKMRFEIREGKIGSILVS